MTHSRRQVVAALAGLPLALAVAPAALADTLPDTLATDSYPKERRRRMRTLFIAGDSTAAQKYAPAEPETGWGMALPFFLHARGPRRLEVSNHAVNGRSSKSFLDEGRFTPILDAISPGDLLLVQFGHNDAKSADPDRFTDPWTSYQDHLRQYLDGARARGARPVLLTSVERRRFDADGNARETHGDYPAAMRALAEREGVALVDVQALSLALWQKLGVEETKRYFNWTESEQDNTHFNPPGAIAVARMVVAELVEQRVLAPADVRRLNDEIPESWITWPQS
ncbi:rhamnogalacturonan acetylesterase [Streptomyces apocyni]|uniref:rhamnogalacturonan acetylesterase n=1 Tax=Streptomyces apocyni TaxID=2654677 RepID=UPI0018D155F1|nr:rhamnogalacturonan acetylesterase [Streptomyces apocyni]